MKKTHFTIPQKRSWHFKRELKPENTTITRNFTLIPAQEPDQVKALQSYRHHPVDGYDIVSIDIIYNEQLNRVFSGYLKIMNNRFGNPKYQPQWKQAIPNTPKEQQKKQWREQTGQQLSTLAKPHQDLETPHAPLLPMWYRYQ